jgi:hypothetical protein
MILKIIMISLIGFFMIFLPIAGLIIFEGTSVIYLLSRTATYFVALLVFLGISSILVIFGIIEYIPPKPPKPESSCAGRRCTDCDNDTCVRNQPDIDYTPHSDG